MPWWLRAVSLVLLISLLNRSGTPQEASVPKADIYSLKVTTNEVVLTFHVTDAHGHAVDNLRMDQVGLYDNLKRPKQILAFESLRNLPLRAGLLIDKSESMQRSASRTGFVLSIGLIYRPAALRPDGTFHSVVLIPPDRASTVTARTGYYAPIR